MEDRRSSSVNSPAGGEGVKGPGKKFGELKPSMQAQRDRDIGVILKIWNIASVEDAFPTEIKPIQLGITAISNIRQIATRVPDLAAAQALFLDECKGLKGEQIGAPIPVSFGHTAHILKALHGAGTPRAASTPNVGGTQGNARAATATPSATPTAGPNSSGRSEAGQLNETVARNPFASGSVSSPLVSRSLSNGGISPGAEHHPIVVGEYNPPGRTDAGFTHSDLAQSVEGRPDHDQNAKRARDWQGEEPSGRVQKLARTSNGNENLTASELKQKYIRENNAMTPSSYIPNPRVAELYSDSVREKRTADLQRLQEASSPRPVERDYEEDTATASENDAASHNPLLEEVANKSRGFRNGHESPRPQSAVPFDNGGSLTDRAALRSPSSSPAYESPYPNNGLEAQAGAAMPTDLLRLWCSLIPNSVRSMFKANGLINLARDDQHGVVEEIEKVLDSNVARLRKELMDVFYNADLERRNF